MNEKNPIHEILCLLANNQHRNNSYLARQEIDRVKRKIKDPKRLELYGFKSYSQGDEDGIIQEIFKRLNIEKGTFFEIGVEDGLECNTLLLIHKGWKGTWVESDQNQMPFIMSKFSSIISKQLNVQYTKVTIDNINTLIGNKELDFLSIDIDGNDVYILKVLQSKPKVICIEYNAKFPSNISRRQVYDPRKMWQGTDYMGSSLKGICEIAEQKEYRLVGTSITGVNAFFVRNDLAKDLFSNDCSSENLYNPARYYLIFDHYKYHTGHKADFGLYE